MQRGQINSHLNCHRALLFTSPKKQFSIHAHSVRAISVMISYQHAQVPRPLNTENNPDTQRE